MVPQWHKADLAPDTEFRVAVIGAGMSGLLTVYRLTQAGVDVVVLEKNPEVGGTWYENQSIRAAGSTIRTTTTATRSRSSGTTGRSTSRPQDVLLDYFRYYAPVLR